MIPFAVAPLTNVAVLVTRPATQAESLCAQIAALGGEAIRFPAVSIEPVPAAQAADYDLIVFVSVNAVAHGLHRIRRGAATRIAAIGKSTAAALAAADAAPDIVPEAGFNSEALLAHPALPSSAGTRVLIVRGIGGRETLLETLAARGMHVDTLEVYRRAMPQVDAAELTALEARWAEGGIDVVTATSVQTLEHLMQMLSETGRGLLRATPLVVASDRIAAAAAQMGVHASIVARGADDQSMLGALEQWSTRAR